MQNVDKLTELVEQAALAVNDVSAEETAEIEGLQHIIEKISQALANGDIGPNDLLEQAMAAASGSSRRTASLAHWFRSAITIVPACPDLWLNTSMDRSARRDMFFSRIAQAVQRFFVEYLSISFLTT